jgi:Tfp pilus assembly protein PilF
LHPSVEAYLVLTRADLHDKDSVGAEQNLQKAVALDPNSADVKAVQQEIQSHRSENAPVQ